jgi:hypothetical protein
MDTPHHEPEDWRAAVERLRAESASVLREMFSGGRPVEAYSGAEDSRCLFGRADRQRAD